jgi:hypothetical protein
LKQVPAQAISYVESRLAFVRGKNLAHSPDEASKLIGLRLFEAMIGFDSRADPHPYPSCARPRQEYAASPFRLLLDGSCRQAFGRRLKTVAIDKFGVTAM